MDYGIDTHKLMYHPRRVTEWMDGVDTYPIYVEVSPSGACNHRCSFCALDFMGYDDMFLKPDVLGDCLSELARLGVRSVHYAGEGEPLLHPDMAHMVRHTTKAGMDVGISTNGVLLGSLVAAELLPHCSWIKVSLNAGRAGTYARIHGCKASDFDLVWDNLAAACELRKFNGYECALGVQMVVLPENENEVYLLAERARDVGMDYVVFKPYARHPSTRKEYGDDTSKFLYTDGAKKLETEDFKVVVRERTLHRTAEDCRPYDRCLALPFWCYIDSRGDVWGCYRHLKDAGFRYGSIYSEAFEKLWNRNKRNECLEMMKGFDISQCGVSCRMDEINRYLWRLRRPEAHDNFI